MHDNYYTKLENVKNALNDVESVKVEGSGKSAFVYASNKGRAIELSQTENGVWVEFWDGSLEPPEFCKTFDDYELAVTAIREWLF